MRKKRLIGFIVFLALIGVFSTNLFAEQVELYYDDGTSEVGPAWNAPGGGFAVLFPAPSPGFKVLKAKFFFHALNNPSDPIKIRVLDVNQNDLITPIDYTVTQDQAQTWIEIDLSSHDLIMDDDFFIAEEQMVAGDPDIGSDTSSLPNGRSWEFYGSNWYVQDGTNYMIRAVVETTPELRQINLVSPPDESTLTMPPTFEWLPDGGVDNAFAVDFALSPNGPIYSTYENGHRVIRDMELTMPQAVWNRIPIGKQVHWRVRGIDLDHEPITVIASDEVWSFTKE